MCVSLRSGSGLKESLPAVQVQNAQLCKHLAVLVKLRVKNITACRKLYPCINQENNLAIMSSRSPDNVWICAASVLINFPTGNQNFGSCDAAALFINACTGVIFFMQIVLIFPR